MKKMLLAIGLVLCCTIGANAIAYKSYTFTGYCDGIELNTNSKHLATGYHLNNDCGGDSSILSGVDGKVLITPEAAAGGTAIAVSDEDFLYPLFSNTGFWVIDEVHLTWALYANGAVLNSGTLTVGAPELAKQGLQSAAAAAKAHPQVYSFSGIPGVYSFTFATSNGDDYCDGMIVTMSGQLAQGTHVYTGCNGSNATVSGSDITAAVNPPDSKSVVEVVVHDASLVSAGGGPYETGFYVLDLNSATWALYVNEGSGNILLNSGLLTNGAPSGPVQKGSSKTSWEQ